MEPVSYSPNNSISVFTKNIMLDELIKKQRMCIPIDKKLFLSDMKRICKFLEHSIFDKCTCSLWTGYITNINSSKGTYINFYFNKKKKALHRLIFINYIDSLDNDDYVKFRCKNKGFCCSVHCMYKVKFKKKDICVDDERLDNGDDTVSELRRGRERSISFDIDF